MTLLKKLIMVYSFLRLTHYFLSKEVYMNEEDLIELIKRELLIFLGTMNIIMADTKDGNLDMTIEKENKEFIKRKFLEINAGNVRKDLLDKAIDDIYPYLRQK